MKNKVISFDIRAAFGMLRKPFSNEKMDLYLTFNMLHKPALLGIIGAVIGLKGYKKYGELPEYYKILQNLKIGIQPLGKYHEKGIFQKTNIKYKNGVGYASKEDGGNLLIHEQTLLDPSYRCYLLFDRVIVNEIEAKIYHYFKNGLAEYLPYLGKNEHSIWFESIDNSGIHIIEYSATNNFISDSDFEMSSIFSVGDNLFKDEKGESIFSFIPHNFYSYFERLPIGFEAIEDSYQYKLEKFIYTNSPINKNTKIKNIYQLTDRNNQKIYVQFN